MLRQPEPTCIITYDASGSWGCGAFTTDGSWFQLEWPASWSQFHITAKEMVPAVVVVAIWGARCTTSSVMIHSDNMAVVSAITLGSAKDPLLMHLSRCLHFSVAHFDIRLVACHIAGVCNTAADALSRNLDVYLFPMLSTGQSQASPGATFTTRHAATSPPRLALSKMEANVSQCVEEVLAIPRYRHTNLVKEGSYVSVKNLGCSHFLYLRACCLFVSHPVSVGLAHPLFPHHCW